jgi:hypothetical protein
MLPKTQLGLQRALLHPLMRGIHPDFSWECLRRIERKVLPALD